MSDNSEHGRNRRCCQATPEEDENVARLRVRFAHDGTRPRRLAKRLPGLFTMLPISERKSFNRKPKASALAGNDCDAWSASALAFGLRLNEMLPSGE
jgi:hypothetical protein